ncbi:Hypothetical protein PROPJV5_1532 [Propionibacterium ruminifibrarum]|uniref:Uncharacterized protein n=2 Tax=Propionibacterium ruminifibrarum TaxID=1962131 RepID=A0A375I472_9ACTN|nr:Hypothetical protein PROPJV5_1532 [Propionibacterium ruminifibrarum]
MVNASTRVRLLCAVNGDFYSHVARVLAIALRLREYPQFDIAFSGSGRFMSLVEDQGFEVLVTDHLTVEEVVEKSDERGIHWYDDPVRLDALFAAEQEVFDRWRPDVCLRDNFRDPASVVAHMRGVLDIMIIQASQTDAYRFDFIPINYDLTGGEDQKEAMPGLVRLARRNVYAPLYAKAREMGLSPECCQDFGAAADLYLVADSYCLFPIKPSSGHYEHVGPLWYINAQARPVWLEEFSNSPLDRFLIATGSTGTTSFDEFFRQVDPQHDTYALAFTDEVPPPFFGGSPSITSTVLPHCDLIVSDGGLGATYMALYAAKPTVAIFDRFEQQANSRALERLGVGIGFGIGTLGPDDLVCATQTLLRNPVVASQLRKAQQRLLDEPEGARFAAMLVARECARHASWASEFLAPVIADLEEESRSHRLGDEPWVAALVADSCWSADGRGDAALQFSSYRAAPKAPVLDFRLDVGHVIAIVAQSTEVADRIVTGLEGRGAAEEGSVTLFGTPVHVGETTVVELESPTSGARVVQLGSQPLFRDGLLTGADTADRLLLVVTDDDVHDERTLAEIAQQMAQLRDDDTAVLLVTTSPRLAEMSADEVVLVAPDHALGPAESRRIVARYCPGSIVSWHPSGPMQVVVRHALEGRPEFIDTSGKSACITDDVAGFIKQLEMAGARQGLALDELTIRAAHLDDVYALLFPPTQAGDR